MTGGYLYPDDDWIKRLARRRLYQTVERNVPTAGTVVTLAGAEAAEIPLLQAWSPPADTWFVDIDPRGLTIVQQQWGAAQIFHGWLATFLRYAPPIRFLHADFMGPYTRHAAETMRAARGRLVAGAIVALTFLRCRDHRWAQRVQQLGSTKGTTDPMTRRWIGTRRALEEDLGTQVRVLDAFEYHRRSSPMAVLVVGLPS